MPPWAWSEREGGLGEGGRTERAPGEGGPSIHPDNGTPLIPAPQHPGTAQTPAPGAARRLVAVEVFLRG